MKKNAFEKKHKIVQKFPRKIFLTHEKSRRFAPVKYRQLDMKKINCAGIKSRNAKTIACFFSLVFPYPSRNPMMLLYLILTQKKQETKKIR